MDAAPAVSLAWFLPPSLFESACEYVLGAGPVAQRVVVMVVRVVLTRVSEGENRFLWGPSTPGSWQVSGPSVFPSCISWLCGDGVAGVCVCVCVWQLSLESSASSSMLPPWNFWLNSFMEKWETPSTDPVSDPPRSLPASQMGVGGEEGSTMGSSGSRRLGLPPGGSLRDRGGGACRGEGHERAVRYRCLLSSGTCRAGCAAGTPHLHCSTLPPCPGTLLAPQLCVLFPQSQIFLGAQIPASVSGRIHLLK